MSYIEREALFAKLHEAGGCDAEKNSWADGWDKGITEAIRLLNEMPPAEATEVRHGEWKEENRRPKSSKFICSACGELAYYIQPNRDATWKKGCLLKYCPNCGAKMDGERSENDNT